MIDTGEVFITNRRAIFQGASQARECRFAQLIRVQHFDDGCTTLSLANRQRPTTIRYGAELSATATFYVELALAHYNGAVDALVEELQCRLDEIDRQRPLEPASGGPQPTAGDEVEGSASPVLADQSPSSERDEPASSARRCELRARRWR